MGKNLYKLAPCRALIDALKNDLTNRTLIDIAREANIRKDVVVYALSEKELPALGYVQLLAYYCIEDAAEREMSERRKRYAKRLMRNVLASGESMKSIASYAGVTESAVKSMMGKLHGNDKVTVEDMYILDMTHEMGRKNGVASWKKKETKQEEKKKAKAEWTKAWRTIAPIEKKNTYHALKIGKWYILDYQENKFGRAKEKIKVIGETERMYLTENANGIKECYLKMDVGRAYNFKEA